LNKEETLALYKQGKDAWNAWAKELLAQRQALVEHGTWPNGEDPPGDNDQISNWCSTAAADFKERTFEEVADFDGFIFPWAVAFGEATFMVSAWFDKATFEWDVEFGGATFEGGAQFGNATFNADARFDKATFEGDVEFGGATFKEDAGFREATFKAEAWFGNATFDADAWFDKATFQGGASFSGAIFTAYPMFREAAFEGAAWFSGVTFEGGAGFGSTTFKAATWFSGATFEGRAEFGGAAFERGAMFRKATFNADAWFGSTSFNADAGFRTVNFTGNVFFARVRFRGKADFQAAKSDRAFTLTESVFETVPDFSQMSFAEAPRLDNLRLQTRVFARLRRVYLILQDDWGKMFLWRRNRPPNEEAAKFRALQRLAERGHDFRLEQEFFRQELKSYQFEEDWPWHPRFWFAVAYEAFSNFGSSMALPLAWLAVSTFLFAAAYLTVSDGNRFSYAEAVTGTLQQTLYAGISVDPPRRTLCTVGGFGNPYVSALSLSGRNSLPFAAGAFTEANRQAYTCLYGYHTVAGRDQPKVPIEVTLLGAAQTVVSLVLIFLFGLALRNNFKIK